MTALLVSDFFAEPGGSGPSEDRVGWTESKAWVIDGATPMDFPPGFDRFDVHWFVERVEKVLRFSDATSPSQVLQLAAEAVDRELASAGFPGSAVPPSAAVGVISVGQGYVEWAVLGDVVLSIRFRGGATRVVSDWSLHLREKAMIEASRRMTSVELRTFGRARRLRDMNSEGGYWVLARSRGAIGHAKRGSVPTCQIDSIMLMSDGFSRAVDTFGLFRDWGDLHCHVRGGAALSDVAQRIRQTEADDPERVKFERLKTMDDSTALFVRFAEEES
jgi:hypothetical protein